MTQRKPGNISWEGWIDQQINQAKAKGEFDNLPGEGKPIPGLDQPYDEMWWVKQKLKNEKLDATPLNIRVRAKTEKWLKGFQNIYSEAALRREIHALNREIQIANRGPRGPMLPQKMLDIEALCKRWHQMNQC